MKAVLFLNGGALQLVTALEACEYFDIPLPSVQAFVSRGAMISLSALEIEFGQVIEVPLKTPDAGFSRREVYGSIRELLEEVRRLAPEMVDYLLLGTNGLAGRALYNQLRIRHVPIVLEDGRARLRHPGARLVEVEDIRGGRLPVRKVIRRGVLRAMGIDERPIPALTFFSHYDFPVLEQDNLVRNEFHRIRRQMSRAVVAEDRILILGTRFLQHRDNTETRAAYLAEVGRIVSEHAGKEILFKPHQKDREPPKIVGITVLDRGTPAEVLVANWERLPGSVYAFNSSALDSLRYLLPEQVNFVDVALS